MTEEEMKLLEQTANLCSERNEILFEIEQEKLKLQKVSNLNGKGEKEDEIIANNNLIQENIKDLIKELNELEQKMSDRTVCCLPKEYWLAGYEIYYLIDEGKADTIKEAINLLEIIDENARMLAQDKDNMVWTELIGMINERCKDFDDSKK